MAKIDAMLWNQNKTESVRASKIRCFGIYPEHTGGAWPPSEDKFKLLGWFSKDEYFYFGLWDTEEKARAYLEGLHKQIEER